jgi:asparagine synthase (glutamine-hydrolysing)
MCGIVGIVDFDAAVTFRLVKHMADTIAYRGPDDEGFWCSEHIILGHRRLAIVDVRGGKQPICNETGAVRVVFNGEIYNHRELRRHLASRGHRFLSKSDAEVIPHLYEEKGIHFVEELDGDFAIALWDCLERALFLVRDPVGVKPLFYHLGAHSLAFASEVKSVLASGYCDVSVDLQGLRDCFYYGQPVAPGTFWSGVQSLVPGTVLRLDPRCAQHTCYYRPLERADSGRPLLKGDAAIEAFSRCFTQAVRKRLPDEVKAGVCLSGGLDSTAVAAVSALACDAPLPTWTIRLPEKEFDEGTFAQYAAHKLNLENQEVAVNGEDACRLFPKALWHLETPQWFGVAAPFLALSQRGHEAGFKVALTGDGADELLGGYDFYRIVAAACRFPTISLKWLKLPISWALKSSNAPSGTLEHVLRVNLDAEVWKRHFDAVPAWIYVWSGMEEVAKPMLQDIGVPCPTQLPLPPAHGDYHRSLYYEYVTRLPNWILLLSDRLSMANGIEVRVPFMDRQLLDLCTELPTDMFRHGGVDKYVLRRALHDQVPEQILDRPKKPFFTPIAAWFLSGSGGEMARDYLSETNTRRVGLFDPQAVTKLLDTATLGTRTWEGMLSEWACLMVMSTHILVDQFSSADLHCGTVVKRRVSG